jgi:hypothetical protein
MRFEPLGFGRSESAGRRRQSYLRRQHGEAPHAQNEGHRLPTLNLTMARAYLSAHDPKMSTRTWMAVMREMGTHGIASSQERCARMFCSKSFDPIRHKPLVQTTAEDLLSIVHSNGHSVAHSLAGCTI